MSKHRSKAFVLASDKRRCNRGYQSQADPITEQFRFVIRLAVACHEAGTAYDVTWERAGAQMAAIITAEGNIPQAKRVSVPRLRLVEASWKPKPWDAEYRLEARFVKPDGCEARMKPAMVISHACGLGLVQACDTGEWGTADGDASVTGKWSVTHLASGKSFGMELPLARAAEALLFAAAQGVDWTLPAGELPEGFRAAGLRVVSQYGSAAQRESARGRLVGVAA